MVSTSWNKQMLLLMLIDLIPIARLMCLLGIWVLLEQTWKAVNLSVSSAEAQTIRGVGHVASIAIPMETRARQPGWLAMLVSAAEWTGVEVHGVMRCLSVREWSSCKQSGCKRCMSTSQRRERL